jgi:aspartate-semialdehyde dehydrogenase
MYSVAIVGATGAVGSEMLRVLKERNFPVSSLRLFASAASAGKILTSDGITYTLEAVNEDSFKDIDISLFSAGGDQSRLYRKWVTDAGCIMIDNSSAFRMEQGVPLVIPEINPEDVRQHDGVFAVPNCSTIVMLMAVAPLRKLGKIKRIVASTYQAVSGAGYKAMKELEEQSKQFLNGGEVTPSVLPYQIAFNLFCHNTAINEHGYNAEEWKMIQETKKILHDDTIQVTATCVRVPVLRAHSESLNIEFEGSRPSIDAVREALAAFPGVSVVDDRAANHFPMPIEAAGKDDILVGHIRNDVSNPNAIDLFVSGDQLLKGAALDAVQIAELLHKEKLITPKRKEAALA